MYIAALAWVFIPTKVLLPMKKDLGFSGQEIFGNTGKKRGLERSSRATPKNQRIQVHKLNLIKADSCSSLFKEIIDECTQVQSDEQDVRLVDVWCERHMGYDFFYGKHQDSLDSFWFNDSSRSSRVPICAYKDLDSADSYLKEIFKKIFPAVYSRLQDGEDAIIACKKEVACYYKIHLMPQREDLKGVVEKIIHKSIECSEFRSLIRYLKVASDFIDLKAHADSSEALGIMKQSDYYMPIIVIYSRAGKEFAQRLLDAIVDLFGDAHGLDTAPRFNRKITSLIYYAQGDGDDKLIPGAEQYFEEDFVHFKSDFTGEEVDYKLSF